MQVHTLIVLEYGGNRERIEETFSTGWHLEGSTTGKSPCNSLFTRSKATIRRRRYRHIRKIYSTARNQVEDSEGDLPMQLAFSDVRGGASMVLRSSGDLQTGRRPSRHVNRSVLWAFGRFVLSGNSKKVCQGDALLCCH